MSFSYWLVQRHADDMSSMQPPAGLKYHLHRDGRVSKLYLTFSVSVHHPKGVRASEEHSEKDKKIKKYIYIYWVKNKHGDSFCGVSVRHPRSVSLPFSGLCGNLSLPADHTTAGGSLASFRRPYNASQWTCEDRSRTGTQRSGGRGRNSSPFEV